MKEQQVTQIRKCIETARSELGLSAENMLKCCYIVTDNRSNIKAALAMYSTSCSCHMITNVVRHTLSASSVSDSSVMYTFENEVILNNLPKTIRYVKNLLTYFKKFGLNNQLKVTFKKAMTRGGTQHLQC